MFKQGGREARKKRKKEVGEERKKKTHGEKE